MCVKYTPNTDRMTSDNICLLSGNLLVNKWRAFSRFRFMRSLFCKPVNLLSTADLQVIIHTYYSITYTVKISVCHLRSNELVKRTRCKLVPWSNRFRGRYVDTFYIILKSFWSIRWLIFNNDNLNSFRGRRV